MLYAKFKDDSAFEEYVMGKQDFGRFDLRWFLEGSSLLQQLSASPAYEFRRAYIMEINAYMIFIMTALL